MPSTNIRPLMWRVRLLVTEKTPWTYGSVIFRAFRRHDDGQVLLCDPMLATGGSALMAIRCLVEAGVKESAVVFVTVVVCPEVT